MDIFRAVLAFFGIFAIVGIVFGGYHLYLIFVVDQGPPQDIQAALDEEGISYDGEELQEYEPSEISVSEDITTDYTAEYVSDITVDRSDGTVTAINITLDRPSVRKAETAGLSTNGPNATIVDKTVHIEVTDQTREPFRLWILVSDENEESVLHQMNIDPT